MSKKKSNKPIAKSDCNSKAVKSKKNIVVMEWYDKSTNLTYTSLVKTETEKEAFDLARKWIADQRKQGIEAIASPVDKECVMELIKKGVLDSEWYDPIKKEYCGVETL